MTKTKNAPAATSKKSPPAGGGPAPTPADPEFEGLMTEIEDELRSEELKKLWANYGNAIIAGAVVIVLAVAGWQYWRQQDAAARDALAVAFQDASLLAGDGKVDEAITALAGIAGSRGEGYAVLAQLQKAALMADQGKDPDGVLAAYRAVIDDPGIDSLFRDLATVLYVMHAMDRAPAAELEAMLAPMLNPANPFHYTGVELTALLADKQGDRDRARTMAEQLLADTAAPLGIRQRAEELAAVFKSASGAAATTAAPAAAPAASN
ncbi:MAG: tetratricopeptide repeat protein [Rhodospirillaceae bacterium]|nr:tetratricopeptide repeat protein [Rhodospirillaceae bacterium]